MNSTKSRHGNKNSKHFRFDIFSDLFRNFAAGLQYRVCQVGAPNDANPGIARNNYNLTRSDGLIQAMQGDQRASIRC